MKRKNITKGCIVIFSLLYLCILTSLQAQTLQWAKRAGGDSGDNGDYGISIAALSDGSFMITGCFYGTSTFGSGESNETILTSAGDEDIFIARYNPDGTLAWAKKSGGIFNDEGKSIAALSDGSSLVTGYFMDAATFGSGENNQTILASGGNKDIFIAKYNPDGTLAWAKKTGGSGFG